MVDRESSEKVYAQIVRFLTTDIESNFDAGDKYLSDAQLSERYAVNRHTIRRAVEILTRQGLLVKRPGSGLYVADKRTIYPIHQSLRLTDVFKALGLTLQIQVLSINKVTPSRSIVEAFSLKPRQQIVCVKTLRYLTEPYQPIALISHYFSPQLQLNDLRHYHGDMALGDYLQQCCAAQLKRVQSSVSYVSLKTEHSQQLNMPFGSSAMKIKTRSVDEQQQLFEYSVSLFPADLIQLDFFPLTQP